MKNNNNNKLVDQFCKTFGEGETRVFSAAGRVNLIGEHIDYNGGFVFPAALNLNCTIVARQNNSNIISIAFTTLPDRVELDISKLDSYKNLKYGNYQAGVAYMLQQDGYHIQGCELLYDANVPFGSGLSSSAAIEVATAITLATFSNELKGITDAVDLVKMAVLSQKAENHYVGVNSGIMDQFASAMGKKDHAILLNCANLDYKYVPLKLGEYSLVIANTNKPRSLTDSKYNERRAECDEALKLLKTKLPGLDYLCALSVDEFEKNKSVLEGVISNRAEHCVYEQDRVLKSVKALEDGDLIRFGELLNESHKSLQELYEVTGIELDTLALTAQQTDGCIGSRMTGAGFGGCTVSLVHKDKVENFIATVSEAYTQKTGLKASFYDTYIADGAHEIK